MSKSHKHLLASQSKEIYKEYWNDYFKFSIVRNPFTRVRSCLKFSSYYGLGRGEDGNIDFSVYRKRFGSPLTIEGDIRFYDLESLRNARHVAHSVYGNILDAEVDFVARFESLERDMGHIQRVLGVKVPFRQHVEKSDPLETQRPLSAVDIANIQCIYARDFDWFGYPRDYEN